VAISEVRALASRPRFVRRLGALLAVAALALAACGTANGAPTAQGSPTHPWSPPPTPGPADDGPGLTQGSQPAVPDSASPTSGPAKGQAGPAAQQPSLPTAVGAGWQLIGSDDFTEDALDQRRWQVYNAQSTNQVSRWDPSMVELNGGELQILGSGKSPDGNGNVSGGVCWCKGVGNQLYGIWQVRARFDAGRGYGQAILLWPQSNRWPQDGELDFVETPRAQKNVAYGTIHWGTDNQSDETELTGDFTQWHVYTVEWRPDRVRMFVDNQVLYDSAASKQHPVIPSTPMQLAMQQEPGPFDTNWVPAPNATTPDQVVMHIDWVRIYH
jgi:endo-1,3-1,4-beta-glycanase ExoK